MSFTDIRYHIVFSTKGRRPFLTPELLSRIGEFIGGIIRDHRGGMLVAGGMPDHIHLATTTSPTVSMSDFLRAIKANSSRWVHETFGDLATFAWQDGYAAFTVSPSVMPKVIEYIRHQPEHHRKMTFEEELKALLDRHGIQYDERYLLG